MAYNTVLYKSPNWHYLHKKGKLHGHSVCCVNGCRSLEFSSNACALRSCISITCQIMLMGNQLLWCWPFRGWLFHFGILWVWLHTSMIHVLNMVTPITDDLSGAWHFAADPHSTKNHIDLEAGWDICNFNRCSLWWEVEQLVIMTMPSEAPSCASFVSETAHSWWVTANNHYKSSWVETSAWYIQEVSTSSQLQITWINVLWDSFVATIGIYVL